MDWMTKGQQFSRQQGEQMRLQKWLDNATDKINKQQEFNESLLKALATIGERVLKLEKEIGQRAKEKEGVGDKLTTL